MPGIRLCQIEEKTQVCSLSGEWEAASSAGLSVHLSVCLGGVGIQRIITLLGSIHLSGGGWGQGGMEGH